MSQALRKSARHGDLARDAVENESRFGLLSRWMKNPLRTGSVVPSSPALCARLVRQTRRAPDEAVIELGAGTGPVSRALLAAGVPPEKLFVVEIVPGMAAQLRRSFPGVNVIEGDARDLPTLIPRQWHGRIGDVICGIPLVLLRKSEQRRFIDAIEAVAPGRGFLHYSYCVTSPLPAKAHDLSKAREAWTPLNFPPASVWRYMPASSSPLPHAVNLGPVCVCKGQPVHEFQGRSLSGGKFA